MMLPAQSAGIPAIRIAISFFPDSSPPKDAAFSAHTDKKVKKKKTG
jgi:hypothetical protein